MPCSYGLVVTPGSDSRFFYRPTLTTPHSYLPFPLRLPYPTRFPFRSVKARAKINDTSLNDDLTFYQLLGIPDSGTLPEIKQAYKQLARKYHPDVSPPDRVEEYTERFIRVQEAYETLSDPRRRALYDRDMASGLHFAFSAGRRFRYDQEIEDRTEWKNCWQVQLSELKRRSMNKDERGNMSWASRMRRQREEMSNET